MEKIKEVLHTQGEWKVEKHEEGRYFGNITSELGRNEKGYMNIRTIAIILKNCGEEEAQANAELICKAVNERQHLLNQIETESQYSSLVKDENDYLKLERQRLIEEHEKMKFALMDIMKGGYQSDMLNIAIRTLAEISNDNNPKRLKNKMERLIDSNRELLKKIQKYVKDEKEYHKNI